MKEPTITLSQLDDAYRQMAQNDPREAEAAEWADAALADAYDASR